VEYRILELGKSSRTLEKASRLCIFVAQTLRVDSDISENAALEGLIASGHVDWKQVLDFADSENITVALAAALRRRNLFKSLPKPVRMALTRREIMGAEVNKRVKGQAEDALHILNAVGVIPIALKGALHLFEAASEELATRFMRDLDLVVPAEKLDLSIAALRDAGYVPEMEDDRWTYHYHPMHHPDHICAIELHVRPGEQRRFIAMDEAWAEAVPVEAPGLQLHALAPNHRIAHNIFHSEIQDHGFSIGELCLRQLYDLARISARFADIVDWDDVSERFGRHGMTPVLHARMHVAVELLGAPKPPFAIDGLRSRLHLRRCLRNLRLKRLMIVTRCLADVAIRVGRFNMDLRYNCGTSGINLQWHRVKHIVRMLWHHRGDILAQANNRRGLKRGR